MLKNIRCVTYMHTTSTKFILALSCRLCIIYIYIFCSVPLFKNLTFSFGIYKNFQFVPSHAQCTLCLQTQKDAKRQPSYCCNISTAHSVTQMLFVYVELRARLRLVAYNSLMAVLAAGKHSLYAIFDNLLSRSSIGDSRRQLLLLLLLLVVAYIDLI